MVHLGECEIKKHNTSLNEKDDSIEAGVRLINDGEDEFNLVLRQQSAEDESAIKNAKNLALNKDSSKLIKGSHNSTLKHRHRSKQHKHQPINRKQRNQLCRKLRCKYNAICKLDQTDLNQTNLDAQSKGQNENIEPNRISLEVTAYCDCSHINCDRAQIESSEELCASDGRMYFSLCQMKEKSCKLQSNIQIEQRSFCDSNKLNDTIPNLGK